MKQETVQEHIDSLKERINHLQGQNLKLKWVNKMLEEALQSDTAHDCNCMKCRTGRDVMAAIKEKQL